MTTAITPIEPLKSMAISQPIDLPRVPTISDLKLEGKLSKEDEETLAKLAVVHPKINFDNITSKEAKELEAYSTVTQNMSRKEIWDIIKPYFPAVFSDILGDKLPKMKEIQKRSNNDENYTPTMEWLAEVSSRIIHVRKDLFKYNIDFGARMFEYRDKPIDFLLMLIKVQKEMYPKRKTKLSEKFYERVQLMVSAHAELLVKLKMIDKKAEDFYGSKYGKIRDGFKTLKNIMYRAIGGKPITIKQQSLMINIIDDYKSALELIFTVNPDDRTFFDSPVKRPKKDVKMCALEIYQTLDDSALTTSSLQYKSFSPDASASEIINSIFIKVPHGKSLTLAQKNGISMFNLEEYISNYFDIKNSSDRNIVKQKNLDEAKDTRKKVIEIFFDILDKHTA